MIIYSFIYFLALYWLAVLIAVFKNAFMLNFAAFVEDAAFTTDVKVVVVWLWDMDDWCTAAEALAEED